MKYLLPPHQAALTEFVNGVLWQEMRACLKERMPEPPDVKDPSHISAQKGHQRAGYELCLDHIEKLAFENDETPRSLLERPAVAITAD